MPFTSSQYYLAGLLFRRHVCIHRDTMVSFDNDYCLTTKTSTGTSDELTGESVGYRHDLNEGRDLASTRAVVRSGQQELGYANLSFSCSNESSETL
jgi:hypothetical protein